MKTVIYAAIAVALLSLTSCKKQEDVIDPDQPDTSATQSSTEIGEPVGDMITKTIGAEGGTLTSTDGKVTLTIPAGAVDKATPFSIEPITNTAPNGVGRAYRFAPDGMQFKTPLSLTYRYEDSEVMSEELLVGYQKPDGMWYSVPGRQVDKSKNQVTVPMKHFSDWGLLDVFTLVIAGDQNEIIYFGESTDLSIFEIVNPGNEVESALLQREFGEAKIGKWTLSGGGKLEQTGERRATYTAPAAPTAQNPVTVSVELTFPKSNVKLILVREIVVGLGYVKINFLGKTYYMTAVHMFDDDDDALINVGGGVPKAAFTLETAASRPGTYPFGPTDRTRGVSQITFGMDGELSYSSLPGYCGDNPILSVGTVTISHYKKGSYVKGSFSGHLVGNKNQECDNSGPAISGEFHTRTLP